MHLWRKWLFSYFTVFPTHWSIHKPFTQGATSTLKDPIGNWSMPIRQFWRDIQLYQLSLCSQASQAIDPSWKPPILTGPSPTCGWPTLRPHKTQDAGFFQACRNHPYNGSMIYAPEMRRGLSGGLPGLPVVQVSGRTAELHGLLLLLVICQGFGSGGHWGRQQGLVVDHMPHDVPVKRGSTGWRSWLGERKYHDQILGKSS